MDSDYRGSEVISTRQPRKPLTGGFLPGLNCRRNSSSSQRFSHLLDFKPHLHFPRSYPPVNRHRKSSECLYFYEEEWEQDENHQLNQPSFRHHKRTNSPSTSNETVRAATLRRRPSSSNLRASASFGTSNPAVVVDSVALKVRQFSATARSASGWCCVGYSNFLPTPEESFAPGHCFSADGTASTRGKHIKRRSSTSGLPKVTSPTSSENLKPQRVYSGNAVTASGEDEPRNSNNSTGATASGLSSGLVASAIASASPKPRSTRAKPPSSSSKKVREKVKDREKVKSKHTEDNVTHGTSPPTSSSSSRTRSIPSNNTSKRLLSSSTRSPCVSRFSTTSPAILNVGNAEPAPGIVTNTTTGSLISASTPIPLPTSTPVFPPYDFFSTPSSSDFVFPTFDALDDLNRWDMESIPLSSDFHGPEIGRNDISRQPHQNRSDSASCTRSPFDSLSCNADFQTTTLVSHSTPSYSPASASVHRTSIAPVASPSLAFTGLFSTPFDDEPIEYEIPFPSMRRVLMEDTRIKKSKTLAADKARAPPYGSSLGGLTSLLMQKPRYVSASVSSTPSSGSASSTLMSSSKSGSIVADSESTPTSTPPRSPVSSLPPSPKSDSRPPLPLPSRLEEGLALHSPVVSRSRLPSLPNGLPSPLFSFYSAPPASSTSTPMQTGNPDSFLDSRSNTPSQPSTSNSVPSTLPQSEDANNAGSRTNRRSPPISIAQPPRHPPRSPLPGIPSSLSSPSSTLSVLPVNAESTSPTTNSASDSGYGSSSAKMRGSGKRRPSPRSSDEEKAKKGSRAHGSSRGNGRHDGKGWGYTTKTWTDSNGCVHLGAEDCVVEVLFPQVKDFEVWDMSDSGWVAVPVLLNILAKDAKRWIGVPLAMPDVTHIDLQCEDVPLPVPFEYLHTGTTLSASSSAFYTNSYSTSFIGGKSALDESSPFGAGKGYRSSTRSSGGPDKGRGMSMMEALRKKEEEQSITSDKISIEGKWVRTYNRPGVEGSKSRTSDDFREDGGDSGSPVLRTDFRRSPGLEGSKDIKNVHRGWYLKFWIPVPTRLFVKRETRLFNVRAKVWMMGDEEKEEKGLRRGNTVLDRFEIGMEEVEKWLGGADTEEDEQHALPLVTETQMTVSHLRKEREMTRWY